MKKYPLVLCEGAIGLGVHSRHSRAPDAEHIRGIYKVISPSPKSIMRFQCGSPSTYYVVQLPRMDIVLDMHVWLTLQARLRVSDPSGLTMPKL